MKKRQIVLYIIVMLILITTSVYATISAELNFTITADSRLYAGDEFSIAIGLKNIDSEKGIKSIEGYINIDENVLENLTVESIVTSEDGKVHIDENNILPVYDAEDIQSDIGIVLNTDPIKDKGDYKLVINLESPIKENTDLLTFNFKIKDNVAPGTYTTVMAYNLFTIFEDDAGEKLELDRKSFKIDISDKNNVNNNTTNNAIEDDINTINNNTVNNITINVVNNTAKPVNNATSKPTNNTTNIPTQSNDDNGGSGSGSINKSSVQGETNIKDSTIAPTNLPKTGYRLLLLPIIVMAIVGLVFYKKYSKYNNYHE